MTGRFASEKTFQYMVLCKLFALAVQLKDESTLNTVFETIDATALNASSDFFTATNMSEVYDRTMAESLARDLVVDLYLTTDGKNRVKVSAGTFPRQFLVDLKRSSRNSRTGKAQGESS